MQYLMKLHCQCRESNLETIASFSSINWKGNYFTWMKVYLSSPPLFTWLDITDVPSFFIRFHCHWITDFLWKGKVDKVHRFFPYILFTKEEREGGYGKKSAFFAEDRMRERPLLLLWPLRQIFRNTSYYFITKYN